MSNVIKRSTRLLHLVTAVDEQRGMIGFCCESRPLATVRCYGVPVRCPFCQQENPASGEQKGGGEADVQNPHSRARSDTRTEER
jgi:hypothetical protein